MLTGHPTPARSSGEPLLRIPDAQNRPPSGSRATVRHVGCTRARNVSIESRLDPRSRGIARLRLVRLEKPFESLGYKQALLTRGSITREPAIASTQLETRQYAKRQLTWFRREKDVVWLRGFGSASGGGGTVPRTGANVRRVFFSLVNCPADFIGSTQGRHYFRPLPLVTGSFSQRDRRYYEP